MSENTTPLKRPTTDGNVATPKTEPKKVRIQEPEKSAKPSSSKSVALNRMLTFLTNDLNKNEMIQDLKSRLNNELDERRRREMIDKAKRVLKKHLNASDSHLKAFEDVINAVYEDESISKKAERVRDRLAKIKSLLKKSSPRVLLEEPPAEEDPW